MKTIKLFFRSEVQLSSKSLMEDDRSQSKNGDDDDPIIITPPMK